MNRLSIALIAYVILGALSWSTISDQRIRMVTLAILAMFALKTVMRRKEAMHPDDSGEGQQKADVARLVEHSLGKGEVTSSILVIGSRDLV